MDHANLSTSLSFCVRTCDFLVGEHGARVLVTVAPARLAHVNRDFRLLVHHRPVHE